MNRELLTQPITGLGPIGVELEKHRRALLALWPVQTPSVRPEVRADGMRLHAKAGASVGGAANVPEMAQIVSVLPNHLVVTIPSLGDAETLVLKPRHLMTNNYAENDSDVLDGFRNDSDLPAYSGSGDRDWFTVDYLMRTTGYPDDLTSHDLTEYFGGVAAGWQGGAQSRFRLVASPARQGVVPSPRFEMLEAVWPPYFTTSGVGGPVGFGDFEAGLSLDTVFVQKLGDDWVDVNQHARRWKQEAEISGDQSVSTPGGIGYLTNVSPSRT